MSGTIVSTVTATTTSADEELQVRNGQDHTRVFDPVAEQWQIEILQELRAIRSQLQIITGEETGE
jgi:hypothetical protein